MTTTQLWNMLVFEQDSLPLAKKFIYDFKGFGKK